MFSGRVIGRVLIPAAAVVVTEKSRELKCRPSELPIYVPDAPPEPQSKPPRPPPTAIEKEIGNIRRQVMSLSNEVTRAQDAISDWYEEVICQAEWLIDYLQEEENTTPRYGAIAIGGLAGFILALRGGKFRKVLFTTAGAVGMAAICYPNEAAEYAEIAKEEAGRYMRIAYNFYHGVGKDDPPLDLPDLPKVPRTLSELMSLFSPSNTSDSVLGDGKKMEPVAEVNLLNLSLGGSDEGVGNSREVITKLHEKSMQEDCHCPIGTCLNPVDEDPEC